MITPKTFQQLFPRAKNPVGWVAAFTDMFPQYNIIGSERVSMFISQCGYESGGWSRFEESLYYTAPRLRVVFRKYFTEEQALEYEKKPSKIASRVYANRMGNGPEESGDGWKYRGRGAIQLTGKNNYKAFSNATNNPSILTNPNQVAKDIGVCLNSALWFWNSRSLVGYGGDVRKVTKRINGGYHGLAEREALFDKVMNAIT